MSIIKNYQPTKGTCKVTFSFSQNAAEGVKTIQVLGDFNNWDVKMAPKMKKIKDEFTTSIELNTGKSYEFKYLLDGKRWENDFNADSYVVTPFAGISNSVLTLDSKTSTATSKVATSKADSPKVSAPKATTLKVDAPKVAKASAVKAATKTVKTVAPKTVKATAPKTDKAKSTTAPKNVKAAAPKATKKVAPKVSKTAEPNAPKSSAPKVVKAVKK